MKNEMYPKNLIEVAFKGKKLNEENFINVYEKVGKLILTHTEWVVLNSVFKENQTLEAVGATLGVCKERVRQFKSNALKKLSGSYKCFKNGNANTITEGTPINELCLTTKASNALIKNNILTIEELQNIPLNELKKFPNINEKISADIQDALNIYYKDKDNVFMQTTDKYIIKEILRISHRYNVDIEHIEKLLKEYGKNV